MSVLKSALKYRLQNENFCAVKKKFSVAPKKNYSVFLGLNSRFLHDLPPNTERKSYCRIRFAKKNDFF